MNAVIGVVGGSGGVGATSFAAVLAAVAGDAILVDVDGAGGGVDVALRIEQVPGARWSGVQVAGGRLDAAVLAAGLPRWGPVAVLAADVAQPDPAAIREVLDAARHVGPVVVDLPRGQCPERAAALLHCDLVVIVARGDIGGLVAAHAVASALPELPVGLVVRRGEVTAGEAAALVGQPLLGELPPLGAPRSALDPVRLPRAAVRVAAGVLAGLDPVSSGRHAVALPA
jgi:MinD-like ATPase involved in chromosome partitioning or flagellar assembly